MKNHFLIILKLYTIISVGGQNHIPRNVISAGFSRRLWLQPVGSVGSGFSEVWMERGRGLGQVEGGRGGERWRSCTTNWKPPMWESLDIRVPAFIWAAARHPFESNSALGGTPAPPWFTTVAAVIHFLANPFRFLPFWLNGKKVFGVTRLDLRSLPWQFSIPSNYNNCIISVVTFN